MSPFAQTVSPAALMRIAMLMAFIQFTSALEYMALTPVFAFMADDFSVPVAFAGYASAAYTFGAVLSGIAAFYQIHRFNKKRFLLTTMLLLGVLTFICTLTTHFGALLVLRFCAGLMGGTTMGVGIAIVINHTPENLRGKMLATVIAAFSMVSIIGMPAVLFLCTHAGWQTALWSVSALCLLSLPPIVAIVPEDTAPPAAQARLSVTVPTLLFAASAGLVQFSPMLIIPVLTPLLMHYTGAQQSLLPLLFLCGGLAGLLATKITGALTTRVSALTLAVVSTLLFVVSLLLPSPGGNGAFLFICLFLGAAYSRLVAASSVALRYPADHQRAGFSSLQTAMMFLITTFAFLLSSLLLPEPDITPQQVNRLLWVSAVSACAFPLLVILLQKKLAKRGLLPATPCADKHHGAGNGSETGGTG